MKLLEPLAANIGQPAWGLEKKEEGPAMARTERASWSARFAPLVVLFVIAAMFFGTALSSAKPKEAGKSESAPGQTNKDTSDTAEEDAGSEEAAKPAKTKPAKTTPAKTTPAAKPAKEKPAKDTSAKPSKPSSGGDGNGSSAGSGSQGSGGGSGKGSGGAKDSGGKKNPPGNNGTIKIDALPFDDHPNNEPHVGCIFQIDLYGYDDNDDYYADYSFNLHAPTLSPSGDNGLMNGNVFIGEDAAGGGRDLDASVTIDLSDALAESGATPHAKQGYHVKLTVHADGSIGADTKYKVFWVQGCDSTSSSAPPSSSQPPGGSQIVSQPPGSSQIVSQPPSSEAPQPSVAGSQLFSQDIPPSDAPPPSPGTTILGRRITTGPSSILPFTGGTVSTLLILAGLLLAAGGATLLGARKYRQTGSMS